MDEDLQRQLRNLADDASPRPGSEEVVVKRAKTKRRLVGAVAGLTLVALIGGLAGATTLLGDRQLIRPAPGPEQTPGCVSANYDLALFVPEEGFHDKMVELNNRLRRHDAVASFRFVSAADALQEYLRENPDDTGPIPTFARQSQYRVTVQGGVDPHRLSNDLAKLGGGAYVPALGCPPREPQREAGERFELLIHCGLSLPLEFNDRLWLPVDPRLRRTHNPPEGFGGDENYDVGTLRVVDEDTIVYTSSEGVEVEYEPTKRRPETCE